MSFNDPTQNAGISAANHKYSSHFFTDDVLAKVPDQDCGNQTLPPKDEEPSVDQEVKVPNLATISDGSSSYLNRQDDVDKDLAKALDRNSDSNLSTISDGSDECYSSSVTTPALTVLTYSASPHSSVNTISIDASEYAASIVPDVTDSEMDSEQSDDESSTESIRPDPSKQLLGHHLFQENSLNPAVHFDSVATTESNGKVIAVSTKPLESGKYEWTLEILSCDVDIAEIGVCSVCDIEGIKIHDDGVTETTALGARAVYGSELATDSVWYASYNENGARRCFKDLKEYHHIGWTCKDRIKVVVNLEKWRIKFYLNGQRV